MSDQSIALSPDEVKEVTGYARPKRQIHALAIMDIPFKVRPNGTVFVARSHVEAAAETKTTTKKVKQIFHEI